MVQEQIRKPGTGGDDGNGDGPKGGLPKIVKIKPGTASEKSIKFVLPEGMENKSIKDVVNYALGLKDINRNEERIQQRIGVEMKDKYGVAVNGHALEPQTPIGKYFREEKTTAGTQYLEAEIIVAARQEGARGLEYILR